MCCVTISTKPVAGPKPTLTPAIVPTHPSSRPRGGGSVRGSRHNNTSRQGTNFRRSSSGASFGRHPYPGFLTSPGAHTGGLDYINLSSPTPEAVARLQEQLLHQSQVNGLQLEQLKARFALQAQQIRAAEQARNASLVHAHTVAQGSSKSSQGNSSTQSPQKTPYVTGNSSPSLSHSSLYPDYLYHPLGYDGQPLTQSLSHDGARTNPSSPSLQEIEVTKEQQHEQNELHQPAAGKHGKNDRMDRLSEQYYHLLIGLCFGFILLIYVLIHITVSVHDMMKRKRYQRSGFDTRHLIDGVQGGGFEEDEP